MNNDINSLSKPPATPVHAPSGVSDQLAKLPIDVEGPQNSSPNPASTPKKSGSKGTSAWRELFSTLAILATALAVAFLIIAFVFRSYQVDGPSMETSLQNGDKLIIWKVPRTIASLTKQAYIPNRGDVIVFNQQGLSQFGQNDSKQLIKRIIALPGERLVLSDGHYTVYNDKNPEGFDPDKTQAYGKNIPITSGEVDVTLGDDQIFVSGDNRPDSLDSRAFGPIQANQIVGKLVLRVFPISSAEVF